MELKVKKAEQGPVLAKKGHVSTGSAGGVDGVEVGTGDNSSVVVGANSNRDPAVGYKCSF